MLNGGLKIEILGWASVPQCTLSDAYSASRSGSSASMISMTTAARWRTRNAATSSATTTSSPDGAEGASVPSLVAVSIALPGRIRILKKRAPGMVEP
jgi:hypothetical protein